MSLSSCGVVLVLCHFCLSTEMKYEHYCINTIDFRASLEEAEQDVDLLEVKLEKVNVFCDDN